MSSPLKRSAFDTTDDESVPSKRSSKWSEEMDEKSPSKGFNRMKVNVRVRPLTEREQSNGHKQTVDVIDNQMLVFDPIDHEEDYVYHGRKYKEIGRKTNKNMKFVFDRVFDDNVTNIQVYEQSTKGFVKSLLNGYNCAVFAYGATGSGKTYTMLGSNDDPGVIFFTTMDLFNQLQEKAEDEHLELNISYFEIYNEIVFDLLDPTSGKALAVREDSHRGVVVQNLSVHQPKDAHHLLEMLEYGNQNRTQHPTDANAESSRSHAVFQISLKKQDFSSTQEMSIQISKMSLIDLAGSERASAAYRSCRTKGLQREGGNINKSLLALGNCITALASSADPKRRPSHIPYRDSKLTLLLRDSLGGNCQTAMIATISPSSIHYNETNNTLVYADRAKGIQLNLKRNSFSVGLQPKNYNNIIESLNRKNVESNAEIASLRETIIKLRSQMERLPDNPIMANSNSNDRLNAVKNVLESLFEDRLSLRRELMECESSLKKIELRLIFRKYDKERHKMLTSGEFEGEIKLNDNENASLQNQKLHYNNQKSVLENKVEENESKIKSIEKQLKEQTDPEDWVIDTFFKNHNMNTEFKDKSFAESHSMEIAKELLSRLEANEELMSESVNLNQHAYHCLNGMGRLSEELRYTFQTLLRKVGGKKSVVWRDDICSPKICKRKEVENIFSLPTYVAIPKTPQLNNTRCLVSVLNITPYTYSPSLTPEKTTPLRQNNSLRNSLSSTFNKSSKVAVVPAYNSSNDMFNDENNQMNGTFTIEEPKSAPSPAPSSSRSSDRGYWKSGSNNYYKSKNDSEYHPYNREMSATKNYKTRAHYQSQSPRSANKYNDRWNRESNYSSNYRSSGYSQSNRNFRSNTNKSSNGSKSPYLPRFRF